MIIRQEIQLRKLYNQKFTVANFFQDLKYLGENNKHFSLQQQQQS